MTKTVTKKPRTKKIGQSSSSNNSLKSPKTNLGKWLFIVGGITLICFFPSLKNGFTNWDDDGYVLNNLLLRGPDWLAIFTQPVLSNYHPLTIISLAINYQISGLDPLSYHVLNLLLHVINTLLVFYLAWLLSEKKLFVAVATSLIFGIHPMHVESVSWIAERKDLLYSFFFLLSLIQYWKYLETKRSSKLWVSFLFFVLSLLSKPSAIILPLVLLLFDHWQGRKLNPGTWIEKIPFVLMSALFIGLTLHFQTTALSLQSFNIWQRILLPCYSLLFYSIRFVFPFPSSPYHGFPNANDFNWLMKLSPFVVVGILVFLWTKRKNKLLIFSIGFFVIDLLLVLQIVPVGYTVVSERYTYLPYFGLGFLSAMLLQKYFSGKTKQLVMIGLTFILSIFFWLSFEQTSVWQNSSELWTAAIKHNDAAIPRTNRASYYFSLADTMQTEGNIFFEKAIEDCNMALKFDPHWQIAYETRGLSNMRLKKYNDAVVDGDSLIAQHPEDYMGYSIRGEAYMRLDQADNAIKDLTSSLERHPNDASILNKRGSIYYNSFQNINAALADFSKAIELDPDANYYLNRSRCYYLLGQLDKARGDVKICMQKGMIIPDQYKKLLNL